MYKLRLKNTDIPDKFEKMSGRVTCCWSSTPLSALVSGLVGTHVHIFVLSNNFTVLELGHLMTRGEVLQLAVTPTGN
jgi:hypothetical protein